MVARSSLTDGTVAEIPLHERAIVGLGVIHNFIQAAGQCNFRSSRAATIVELDMAGKGKVIVCGGRDRLTDG